MTALIFACLLFVGSHVLFSSTPVRGNLIRLFGESGFLGLYSLAALLALGWMTVAFFDAPQVKLWGDPLWARGLLLLLMPIVSVFLVAGFTSKNPPMADIGKLGLPHSFAGRPFLGRAEEACGTKRQLGGLRRENLDPSLRGNPRQTHEGDICRDRLVEDPNRAFALCGAHARP